MGVEGYYAEGLAGARLRQCYEVAPLRMQRALAAEIEYVLDLTPSGGTVLELGCGYGRVLQALADQTGTLVGIDTSIRSLNLARELLSHHPRCHLSVMDASSLALAEASFDLVICVQNGLSVFGRDPLEVMKEACRVTRPTGRAVFSSYSDRIWTERLAWFRIQAEHGLIGAIDEQATGDGLIVCHDGFRATTIRPADFCAMTSSLGRSGHIAEVDESTVFCIVDGSEKAGPGGSD